MPQATPLTRHLVPRAIAPRAAEVWCGALASGALEPIPTRLEIVEQAGVRFQIRILDSLWRKERALARQRDAEARGQPRDPFGPCDPDLLLGDLSPTHCCVLNKFPALARHLLIVTRAPEPQEQLLTTLDLVALWTTMAGMDGFAFYNGGQVAGASQGHKHLQLVPLPMAPGEPIPMERCLARADFSDGVGRVPGLPFEHAMARLPEALVEDPRQAALASLGTYRRLLAAVGLARRPGSPRQAGPYNLLMTRRWMLLVPRARERWQGTSVNALGFAGSLLARDQDELERIIAAGPMRILGAVGVPQS